MKVNFGRILLQTARQFSDKKALVNVEKNRSYTFMELHLLANKICNMMRDRFGLKSGDVYGNLLENDNNSLFNVWVTKSEPSGLWFNYRDSFDEHMYQIDYVNPKLIFVENEILEKENYYNAFRERGMEIVCMEKPRQELPGVQYFWDLIETASDAEVEVEYDIDEHITLYRFTGGTTGRGKCAAYSLRNFLAGANHIYGFEENIFTKDVKHLHITPLSHASSLFVLPIHFKGGTQYTINLPNLEHFSEAVQFHQITSTFVVPTILYHLVDLGLEEKYDLSSLNTVFYGASPMSPSKLEILHEKFGNIFIQAYGATEAWPMAVVLGKADHIVTNEKDKKRLSSTGKVLPTVEIRIVDDNGKDMPVGEPGEIWIRGANVIKGYHKDIEETRANFTENGFWKSGDIAYFDESGYVFIVDRKKDMIITGGFNVYAIEVENALNSHHAVQQSVVIGIPHEQWGESVHAEVILKESMTITEEELINFTKDKIGRYKVPKSIKFVNELPLSTVGKVLRRKVRDKYWKEKARKIN
ncbi:class I adenylate-forming enzyme family protein [Peribacillus glennii]|uniref:Long-chain fatty acid--CoA ligase n=1 Tax=Peribacillus glennii TaxID=2303991 RepID=A0A372LFC9_9BACI|nr:AMP-binding protein [Peribacillus glennii]RFU64988.1 long-chain fatty acid--CoA ligase [Peribacillus glennii]